ncbi:MAG: alpha/beta fold hydrolase [Verrucomicrobiota bacterium]
MEREIPLYTLDGVRDAEITTHWFSTADKLGLSMLRFCREPSDDVVLVVHGLTTSSDMFIMPEHENLVTFLHRHGFGDVWTLDFRMSNRFAYNLRRHVYTMDDVALYDFPAALETLRAAVGDAARVHVICHCLGSVAFMMSLYGKAVDGIASVISNSVSLTPRIRRFSSLKIKVAPPIIEGLLGIEYINPLWSADRGATVGKLISKVVSAVHRECDVPACHMLSMMWGTGFPALYRHENLDEVTHRRGGDLYGGTSLNYHRHVRRMVEAGHAVKFRPGDPRYRTLPDDYLEHAHDIDTPVLLITGRSNQIFTNSQLVTHRMLQARGCTNTELHVFETYGHQDVFMGKNVAREVFPRLLEFLGAHSSVGAHRSDGAVPAQSP